MTRILLIQGHPDPDPRRLCRALADAYTDGARSAKHEVDQIDLATLELPLLRSQNEFEHGLLPAGLQPAQAAVAKAEHLVLVFPLWLGGAPAIVKVFLEQVMRPGLAFRYRPNGLPEKLLAGCSAHLVVTMGMPAFAYRWWYGAYGVKAVEHNILRLVGIAPVRRTLLGSVNDVSPAKVEAWLAKMRKLGARAR